MVNGEQPKASIGELVAGMANDVSTLVRSEIELAKAELRESAKRGAAGTGLLVVAVVLLLMVWLLLTFAAVYGLSAGTGLSLWASFLIVAGFYLVVAAILIWIGSVQFRKVRGPEQAMAAQTETKEIVSRLRPGAAPTAASPTVPNLPTAPTAPGSATAVTTPASARPSASATTATPTASAIPAPAPGPRPSPVDPDQNRADH